MENVWVGLEVRRAGKNKWWLPRSSRFSKGGHDDACSNGCSRRPAPHFGLQTKISECARRRFPPFENSERLGQHALRALCEGWEFRTLPSKGMIMSGQHRHPPLQNAQGRGTLCCGGISNHARRMGHPPFDTSVTSFLLCSGYTLET